MDIELFWDAANHRADMKVVNGDLAMDNDIKSAVVLSLFTNRRAEDDDELPAKNAPRQGWWGDALGGAGANRRIGSRLWLLGREKQLTEVLARAREYAEESLAWLVEDGVASSVKVETMIVARGVMGMTVAVERPKQQAAQFKFSFAWANISEARN